MPSQHSNECDSNGLPITQDGLYERRVTHIGFFKDDHHPEKMQSTMLSKHSTRRNSDGIPVMVEGPSARRVKRRKFADKEDDPEKVQEVTLHNEWVDLWNKEHLDLVAKTRLACALIESIKFLQRWSLPLVHLNAYPLTRHLAEISIESSNDKTVEEELELLVQIIKSASVVMEYLTTASMMSMQHTVSDIMDALGPINDRNIFGGLPQGLLRLHGPQSHTEYDNDLGFLSSSWQTSSPATSFQEMEKRGASTVASLKSHCEHKPQSSEWISSSGEVSWMLKYIDLKWPACSTGANNMRISLISTAKMERLKIPIYRSDFLVQSAGGSRFTLTNPEGVKFAWDIHYLIYGWIPKPCIVRTFSLPEFRDICRARNIQPSQYTKFRIGRTAIDPL
ncbi:MAG: hypothetical protein Q9180_002756 [Flavoplaca navasiana]